jgi:hypothetical protein
LEKRGYVAPEYALHGQLQPKTDVFSFGIIALELVTGRENMNPDLPRDEQYLLAWVSLFLRQWLSNFSALWFSTSWFSSFPSSFPLNSPTWGKGLQSFLLENKYVENQLCVVGILRSAK